MPDLLGATNPVPSYDAPSVRITPPTPGGDTNIQNVVDPNRVVRPDGHDGQQNSGNADNSFGARFESNYMTFLQRLRGSSDVARSVMTVLQGQSVEVSSGIRSGFAQEMSEFLEFIRMNEGELLSFLQNQLQSGSRFSGALFQILRGALNDPASSELTRNDILQFVRRFADYSSTEHIEANLLRMTDEMTEALPGKWSQQLTEILAKYGLTCSEVPLYEVLHLKTGVNYLENGNMLVSGEFVEKPDFAEYNRYIIPEEEAYAANCIWVNDTVIVPEGYPAVLEAVKSMGYKTLTVDTSEYRKLDGGLSCLSLRF